MLPVQLVMVWRSCIYLQDNNKQWNMNNKIVLNLLDTTYVVNMPPPPLVVAVTGTIIPNICCRRRRRLQHHLLSPMLLPSYALHVASAAGVVTHSTPKVAIVVAVVSKISCRLCRLRQCHPSFPLFWPSYLKHAASAAASDNARCCRPCYHCISNKLPAPVPPTLCALPLLFALAVAVVSQTCRGRLRCCCFSHRYNYI